MRFPRLQIHVLSSVLTILVSISSYAGGGSDGGTGSVAAQEAKVILNEVVRRFEKVKDKFPQVDFQRLKNKAAHALILAPEKTFLNGVETDALNDGDNTIQVSWSRWPSIMKNERISLLFHELLGLIHVEVNDYAVSASFVELFESEGDQIINCLATDSTFGWREGNGWVGNSMQIMLKYSKETGFRYITANVTVRGDGMFRLLYIDGMAASEEIRNRDVWMKYIGGNAAGMIRSIVLPRSIIGKDNVSFTTFWTRSDGFPIFDRKIQEFSCHSSIAKGAN